MQIKALQLRVRITGASGSGVTTVGQALAEKLRVQQLDVDVYWMPTDPAFHKQRSSEERVRLIREELLRNGPVLTGYFVEWGHGLIEDVKMIDFVDTPIVSV